MSPARLARPLDPIYQGSVWAQPIQFYDETTSTPRDLTGATVKLHMARQGLPVEVRSVTAVPQGSGLVIVGADETVTDDWTDGRYTVEITIEEAGDVFSVAVGEVQIIQGASQGGNDRSRLFGAYTPPGVLGVVTSATGSVQVVMVDRLGAANAASLSFDDTLTMLGVDNVQDAIVALYELIGSGPPAPSGGVLDFSNPANSALIGAL
jgi:hypothetical protein